MMKLIKVLVRSLICIPNIFALHSPGVPYKKVEDKTTLINIVYGYEPWRCTL